MDHALLVVGLEVGFRNRILDSGKIISYDEKYLSCSSVLDIFLDFSPYSLGFIPTYLEEKDLPVAVLVNSSREVSCFVFYRISSNV